MSDDIRGLILDDLKRREDALRSTDGLDPDLPGEARMQPPKRTLFGRLDGIPIWDYEDEWGQL